ncbi:hypothetical protein PH242_01915 [Photorhabdus bodei]|nr:hypothetical protein [Photorhabdus bodei]MDB6366469.1 hypothetical protein [Photorhabdus bodei]
MSECSQQRGNLKDDGYKPILVLVSLCISSKDNPYWNNILILFLNKKQS